MILDNSGRPAQTDIRAGHLFAPAWQAQRYRWNTRQQIDAAHHDTDE
jgi:hypothetical protein